MGICQSAEEVKAHEISRTIDKHLQLQKKPAGLVQKMLLLGPSESGKSTCIKQMQILHTNGFSNAEVEERKCIVYSNTVRSMLELTEAMFDLNMDFQDPSLMNDVAILRAHIEKGHEFTSFPTAIKLAVQRLWTDEAIREAYEKRSGYHIHDNAAYFFDHIERIAASDYRPSNHDILLTRVPTTGVVKLMFRMKNIDFNVFDVGGQRSERRKWIHFFDDVNAIIFVVAISEYDQRIREDNKTNRLTEALVLFNDIANNKFFLKSSMILFLNKKDLFEEKVKKVPLNVLFPSYKGGMNYEHGIAYLRRKFEKLYKNDQKLYTYATCATDTNQLNSVFNSVLDMILKENVTHAGML